MNAEQFTRAQPFRTSGGKAQARIVSSVLNRKKIISVIV
jgi:hypothetical protein